MQRVVTFEEIDNRRGHAGEPGGFSALDGVETKAIEVEAAYGHTLVKTDDGEIFSCGCGDDGATGHGDEKTRSELTIIEGVPMDPADIRALEAKLAERRRLARLAAEE